MKQKAMLDHIERWLTNAPTHPHIEHEVVTDMNCNVTGVEPSVVETLNKEAILSEWQMFVRPDLESS